MKITIKAELSSSRALDEQQITNLITNSLSWIQHRVRLGARNGNLHGTSGPPYGKFEINIEETVTK